MVMLIFCYHRADAEPAKEFVFAGIFLRELFTESRIKKVLYFVHVLKAQTEQYLKVIIKV